MPKLISRRLAELRRAEDGFTLATVMGVLLVVGLFAAGAMAASGGDLRPGANDRDRKVAFAAAEAGVQDYLARLTARPDYWKDCINEALATPVRNPSLNQVGPPTDQQPTPPANARRWATIPGSTAQYSIELLPANGATSCNPSSPADTFVDQATGTFRIRVTGRPAQASRVRRSVVATFRRKGFLDYIYYTDYEGSAPALHALEGAGYVTKNNEGQDIVTWAKTACAKYRRAGRGDELFRGDASNLAGRQVGTDATRAASWQTMNVRCGEIQFAARDGYPIERQDQVLGPMHTEDEIRVCGKVTFGRRPSDTIEILGQDKDGKGNGWHPMTGTGCGTSEPIVNMPGQSATTKGTWQNPSASIQLPPSNAALEAEALPAYRFLGRLRIELDRDRMIVLEGKRLNGQTITPGTSIPLPLDGVIYVGNDGVCPGYDPLNPYGAPATCGDLWVQGTYSRSLTINTANDIIIREDIQRDGDVMLGLVSDGWTRVYRPVTGCHPITGGGSDTGDGPGTVTIHAAILSVQQSFTVDNYWCAGHVGTLDVNGAIGQRHRGPVGTGAGTTGYYKKYTYDDRFRFRSPPRFLDPVQSAWRLQSQAEQVPPADRQP